MHIPRGMAVGIVAMVGVVACSNVLVQYQINSWLTWGAFAYPVAFLVTDLTNRAFGPRRARQVVYVGFALAVVFSAVLATPRIAAASGLAFLAAQLLDVRIFDRFRHLGRWWMPPLVSSLIASAVDTALFFSIAFAGTEVPWVTLGLGDYAVKLALALSMLIPFRALMPVVQTREI